MPSSKRKDSQKNVPPPKRFKEAHLSDGEFQVVRSTLTLSVPPVFAVNPSAGIEEMLDSMIMRYIPSLKGVVLSHSNLLFVNKEAVIQRDCPFLVCKVAFDATVWSPRVGQKLSGKINLSSPDHISLLVHRTFNVSIPRHHIITDSWEFEYGPTENDPEFGATVDQEKTEDDAKTDCHDSEEHGSGGKWVHKVTAETLGGKSGILEFTVIGLTVANEMLSLLGSLQPDPFSPRHTVHSEPQNGKRSSEDKDSDNESNSPSESDEDSEDEDSADGVDTFRTLGKRKDREDRSDKRKKE